MDSGDYPAVLQKSAPRPFLIVLHQEHSTPGHVGRLLEARGHPLDIRRPRYGDPLPATLAAHAGAVILGGPMSANDPDDFIRREFALIEVALREGAPYLGICLGAQMMATCLGSQVRTDPGGQVEIGYHAIEPVGPEGPGGTWPDKVYQWHREGFQLPSGATPLATSSGAFPNQAFSVGSSALGLQFHPEITYGMIARWSSRNEHRLTAPGAQPRIGQLADHISIGPSVRNWFARLLEDWIASDDRAASQN